MSEILIFGGTTEGRRLAEFCTQNKIRAYVSVTTDYGAELLNENEYIKILNGKLGRDEIIRLIYDNNFGTIIDATHPYAVIATENIRFACAQTEIKYFCLKRESNQLYGTVLNSFGELSEYLNRDNRQILSTLGSKELSILSHVHNCFKRV